MYTQNKKGKTVGKEVSRPLPFCLKKNFEAISGYDLSDVTVHYHSTRPYNLGAVAYAQGSDIYLAPGQEKHLAHEAWHIVQQRQGRVTSTLQLGKYQINNEEVLEHEAHAMASGISNDLLSCPTRVTLKKPETISKVIQRMTFEEASRLTQGNYAIGTAEDMEGLSSHLFLVMPTDNLNDILYGDRPDLLSTRDFYQRIKKTCAHLLALPESTHNFLSVVRLTTFSTEGHHGALLKKCTHYGDYQLVEVIEMGTHTPDTLFTTLMGVIPDIAGLSSDDRWEAYGEENADVLNEEPT